MDSILRSQQNTLLSCCHTSSSELCRPFSLWATHASTARTPPNPETHQSRCSISPRTSQIAWRQSKRTRRDANFNLRDTTQNHVTSDRRQILSKLTLHFCRNIVANMSSSAQNVIFLPPLLVFGLTFRQKYHLALQDSYCSRCFVRSGFDSPITTNSTKRSIVLFAVLVSTSKLCLEFPWKFLSITLKTSRKRFTGYLYAQTFL